MQLAFETRELRDICEDPHLAMGELGEMVAEQLMHRLADLRAATTIDDVVVGNMSIIGNPHQNQVEIDLYGGQKLVLCANHVTNPTAPTGEVDWSQVRRVKIMEIS